MWLSLSWGMGAVMACGIGLQTLAPAVAIGQHPVPETPAPYNAKTVLIHVDLSKAIGPYKPIYAWFGYDEANYTTMPHGRQLLKELHDLTPAPVYIRAHNLLTSGNGKAELKFSSTNVYTEDANGKPEYNFTILDGIFDAYKAAGVRPLVELGFMPKDLAASLPNRHEPYEVHYPQNVTLGASNNPPKNYAKWGEFVRAVTAHLVARYGKDEVLQWYFEVWNEPNISYWHGTQQDYWKLYDYAVAGVRAALPGAKVGGPASTSPRDAKAYAFLNGFLDHVNSGRSAATGKAVPLDFISFHAKGQPTIQGGKVTMGINRELTDADRGFALVAKYPRFKHLPIILSEADPEGCAACSSKVNPANNYRNGTLYPAYTAAALKGLLELQDQHEVNLIAMLSWSFEFENRDYFEGFRSLATNGIDKPILNLFRMYGLMAGSRMNTSSTGKVQLDTMLSTGAAQSPDVDAMATRGNREAAVLVWNYHDTREADTVDPTMVTIAGLPADIHRVLLEHYRIDDTHSNAYTAWQAMGSPQHPTAAQYKDLQADGELQLLTSPTWLDAVDGKVKVTTVMPGESVSLLRLSW